MIHGLKLSFTGEEVIRSLDERIEACRAAIQYKRDEIDGKVPHDPQLCWQVPVEAVEAEIREVEYRLQTLTMYRERVVASETYLLGRRALKLTGLTPKRSTARAECESEKEIHWVTRS